MDAYTYLTGKQYVGYRLISGGSMQGDGYSFDDLNNVYLKKKNKTNFGSMEIFDSLFGQDEEENGGEV